MRAEVWMMSPIAYSSSAMLKRGCLVTADAKPYRLVRVISFVDPQFKVVDKFDTHGWIRAQMDRYDCIEYARRYAHRLAGAALHEYSLAFAGLPESRDKRFLEEMVTWVVERN